jgi:predicted Zn-dependent peptidase
MRVTLVPYGEIPKVTVSAVVRSGSIDETENQVWLASLTGLMMKEGTKTRSATQLAEEASSMGGSISISVGADNTVSVATFFRHSDRGLSCFWRM